MFRVIRSLATALAAVALFVTAAWAEPAMWVAHGPAATIYLYGTFHLLPKAAPWRGPRLARALASANEIWLEVADIDDVQALRPLIVRYGTDLAHPLSSVLTPAQEVRLQHALQQIGLPLSAQLLDPLRPWLVEMMMVRAMAQHAGYDPSNGADLVLLRAAREAGKPVRGLETMEGQLRILAGLPLADQVAALMHDLEKATEGRSELDRLAAAWAGGDTTTIADLLVADMAQGAPAEYRALIVARNAVWALQIAARLKGQGTVLVAVGAGHLAGPDDLQAQLAKLGVTVERLP
jgi:uncharacterized protein YbaP (TraB family)